MAANIDITRTKGSTTPMTFTITDELGGVQSIANWSDFDLVVYVSPAKEYSRTVTFSDTGGGTFTEDVRVIVGDSELEAGKEIVVQTPSKRTLYVSSGSAAIPVFYKDPSDVVDFMLDFSPFLQTDNIASYTIDSKNVSLHADYFDDTRVQVWLEAGLLGAIAEVTVAIKSDSGRTVERSIKVKINDY